MRWEDWRPSENVIDQRPLPQRFMVMPMAGYLGAVGAGYPQQLLNERAAGLGSDIPTGPVAPSEYRPRGIGPERPPVQELDTRNPDYRPGGPERNRQDEIEYLRSLYQWR